jgi:hypothetical protein
MALAVDTSCPRQKNTGPHCSGAPITTNEPPRPPPKRGHLPSDGNVSRRV